MTTTRAADAWRCAGCGARNVAGAGWCTQCYAAADAPAPPSAEVPEAPPPAGEEPERDVRVSGELVEWRCGRCGDWTDLTAATCRLCGAQRTGFGTEEVTATRHELTVAQAVGASLAVPGLGHVLAGRLGSGIARGLLALGWGWLGLVLLLGAGADRLLGGILLLAGVVVYLGTAADARGLVDGSVPTVLTPRRLAWGVVAVAVAVTVAAAATTLRGT